MSQQKQGTQNKGTNNKGANNTNKGNSGANNKPGNTKAQSGSNQANKAQSGNAPANKPVSNKPKVDSKPFPAVVRAVPSGDTIVILKEASEELQITLLGLKAPLLGKKTKDEVTKDQPFAWESREFLRSLLIGKSVVCRIEHEAGTRSYGDVWLQSDNVRNLIVQKGWAEVSIREKKDKEGAPLEPRKEDQELLNLQEVAKSKKVGIWQAAGAKHVRNVKYHENKKESDPDQLFAFFEKNKNKSLNAIVEQVKTGSTLKVYVPSTADEFTVSLSGVHCPIYRFNDESACEPFSREAKFFTEHCLLNRDVIVTLESMDKINNYFGTVVDADKKRNVASNLLKMGLGSFVEWNAPAQHAKEWQAAEKEARDQKLRIWKKWKPSEAKGNVSPATAAAAAGGSAVSASEFLGTVVEVVNAGLVVVRIQKGDNYTDVNVNLSSIRVPRAIPVKKAAKEQEEEEAPVVEKDKKAALQKAEEEKIQNAYAHVAKEFLRKELIGKKVKVVHDYTSTPYQPAGSNKTLPARAFYSVYVNGKTNVAVRLVQRGLALVASHQEGDARSPDYKDLILAEKAAKQEQSGQHAPKSKAPVIHLNDISNDSEAKNGPFLPALKRVGKVPAVIEYVFSSTKFKVHVPSQGLTIAFSIQGAMSDRLVKNDKAKPNANGQYDQRVLYPVKDQEGNTILSNVAYHFARDNLFQHDVEISVEDIDRFGTFMGTLTVNKTDYLLQLVERAFVKLHRSAEKLPGYRQYIKIEEGSKKQKKGVWHDWDEVAEQQKKDAFLAQKEEARQEREQQKAKEKVLNITITEIITGSTFFFQKATDETKQLMEDMMSDLQSRGWDSRPEYAPEKGEWVAAKFTVDNNWYRAEVLRVPSQGFKDYELRYVDYGNTEFVSPANIRQLDDDLADIFAQSKMGKIAYIRAPALDDEYGEDAAAFFKELVWGKTILGNIQFTEGHEGNEVYHLTLGDSETKTDVAGALVMQGLARVETRRQTRIVNKSLYDVLQSEENKAKNERLCIWQYGAIPDSDEDRQWANMLK